MDAAHLNTSSSQEMRFWNSPIFKYSLISAIALAALSCIVLGALAYSGTGLSSIGKSWGIALIVTGTLMIVGSGLVVAKLWPLMPRGSDFPIQAKKLAEQLQPGELMLYQDDSYAADCSKKRLWFRGKNGALSEIFQEYALPALLDEGYKEVKEEELRLRKKTWLCC